VAAYWNYELPFTTAAWAQNPVMKGVLKGWQLNGQMDYQSGQPFTIRTGVDTGGTGTSAPHRPDYNPGGTIALDPVTGNYRTFITPINGTGIVVTNLTSAGSPLANSKVGGGNLGRNTFRGPGFRNWSLSTLKQFEIAERWKVQLRADFINAFNMRNFGNPTVLMNSPNFGVNTSDPGSRSMLVSAKIRF
jgi:hypothetical protein